MCLIGMVSGIFYYVRTVGKRSVGRSGEARLLEETNFKKDFPQGSGTVKPVPYRAV